ncbi:MAG: NADH-quinone oxidoreductase subunit C, partial [Gammaproteobacteria bacterium]|nr:NADH-quinone oxidoreductase subunit C [Gammaproteobacteria bacterium]
MSARLEALLNSIGERFGSRLQRVDSRCGELGFEVGLPDLIDVCRILRDDFAFEVLVDLCGVDYLTWGKGEWER